MVDFEREKQWWNARAIEEEKDLADEGINRVLRWREIEKHLEGVQTILSVGAGTGVFTIPLAKHGFSVVHLDISPIMIEIAQRKAEESGVKGIHFLEANAVDLSMFEDQAFDLVLNMDGAISFCGSEAEKAINESCRVTRRTIISTISNRARAIPQWIETSMKTLGTLAPAAYSMFSMGRWDQYQFPENETITRDMLQSYFGAFKAFTFGEARDLFRATGLELVRLSGLGSLTYLCGAELLAKIWENKDLIQEFIELCDRFDREILPFGPGTMERSGIMVVAKRPAQES